MPRSNWLVTAGHTAETRSAERVLTLVRELAADRDLDPDALLHDPLLLGRSFHVATATDHGEASRLSEQVAGHGFRVAVRRADGIEAGLRAMAARVRGRTPTPDGVLLAGHTPPPSLDSLVAGIHETLAERGYVPAAPRAALSEDVANAVRQIGRLATQGGNEARNQVESLTRALSLAWMDLRFQARIADVADALRRRSEGATLAPGEADRWLRTRALG